MPLDVSVGVIKAKMRGNGHMYIYLMDRYRQEVATRADVIWRNLHRAHVSFGAPLAESLREDLREAFRAALDGALTHLSPSFERDMQEAPQSAKERTWVNKFGDARDHELARYEAEIEHYVASLENAKQRGAQPAAASYVVHGNVGAIVSGAGASAHVVQHIGSDQREALLKALEIVRHAVAAAPELVEADRRELLELSDEASSEVCREQPNTRRLSLALQTLAATVQGIASGPAAYQVLASAAAAVGLYL